MSTFGDRLRLLRTKHKLSQTRLGEVVQASQQTVAKWEKGNGSTPELETLVKLADYFSVTTDYLLGRCDAEQSAIQMAPLTVAAHTNTPMTPENEARVKELIQEAFEMYVRKDPKDEAK